MMGHLARVLAEARLGVVTLSGAVDGRGLLLAMADVFLDPRWEPGFDVVWDGRAIRELDLVPADLVRVRKMTTQVRDRMGPGRAAILVRGELDEMAAALLEKRSGKLPERTVRTFRQAAEAAAWLGVGAGLIEPSPQAALEG